MKKTAIIFFMSVMPCIVFGQNIKYSYDNSGNRIKKEIVMNTRAISKEESSKKCNAGKTNDFICYNHYDVCGQELYILFNESKKNSCIWT